MAISVYWYIRRVTFWFWANHLAWEQNITEHKLNHRLVMTKIIIMYVYLLNILIAK